MKNKVLIIIIVIVILIIILACASLLGLFGKPSMNTDSSGNVVKNIEPKEEIVYPYLTNIAYDESDLDNSFSDDEAFKTINGVTYKNINSIPDNAIGNYNYSTFHRGDAISYEHDTQAEKLFTEDKLLLPKALFLVDNNINAYYSYLNELYYIPIVKCDKEEDERILFRDYDLSIGKNNGNICINGVKLSIDYNYSEGFEGLFYSYFIVNPELSDSQINLYKTNIDSDSFTTDIRLVTVTNSSNIQGSICNTFILMKPDWMYDLCVAPMDLGVHVDNYSNLYYKESGHTIINESGEKITNDDIHEYYLLENGFRVIEED